MLRSERMTFMDGPILDLYKTAFSDAERIPLENIHRAMGKGAFLDAYSDEGRFIGFIYGFIDGDKLFFIYFATVPEVRGQGYGAQILKDFRQRYQDKRSFLVTEPKDSGAEDYIMRVRRQNYYIRNGCTETGIKLLSDDVWFDAMFIQGTLSEEEMVKVVTLYEDIHNGRA